MCSKRAQQGAHAGALLLAAMAQQVQRPHQTVVVAGHHHQATTTVKAISRLDTGAEVEYYRNGGILHYVLRQMMKK